jgi:hypothetical protein
MFEIVTKLKKSLSKYLDFTEAERKLTQIIASSVKELQDFSVTDIRQFFGLQSSEARYKLKKLRHFCQCFRGLRQSSMKSFMENCARQISADTKTAYLHCFSRGKNSANEALDIVKLLHFLNHFEDIFELDKAFYIHALKLRLKDSSDIGSISMHVMSLSAHLDLGAAASEAISIFPAFRHIFVQLYNQKAGHMDVTKVLEQIETEGFKKLSPIQESNCRESYDSYQKIFDDSIMSLIRMYDCFLSGTKKEDILKETSRDLCL